MIKPNVGKDVERPDPSHDADENVKMYSSENNVAVPSKEKKLNMKLPYDPAMTLLGIYLKEIKTYIHTKTSKWEEKKKKKETYTGMLIIALSVMAPNWKLPRCSYMGEQ